MSRFAIDPRWLVYLPPTMSPTATSQRAGPARAPRGGVRLVPLGRRRRRSSARRSTWARARSSSSAATPASPRDRFGVDSGETGAIYTRTGRPFFDDAARPRPLGSRARRGRRAPACGTSSAPDWLVLDCELLPWSAKAMELIQRQYAPVGAAARAGLTATLATLERGRRARRSTSANSPSAARAAPSRTSTATSTRTAATAGRSNGVDDLRLAPFHVLAAEAGVFVDRDHAWHMDRCDRLVAADPVWFARAPSAGRRRHRRGSQAAGVAWWEELTAARRRGDGREAAGLRRPRPQGPRAARHQVPRPRVPADHLRPRVRRPEPARPPALTRPRRASARSRCASSGSASRRSSGSSAASRSTACTSACSACSRWRASRSTRACSATICGYAVRCGLRCPEPAMSRRRCKGLSYSPPSSQGSC